MLNNQYYSIYNDSLSIIYDSLSELIITEKKTFVDNYTLYNNKKITDYMLFVRNFYKNKETYDLSELKISNKSKYISILWKELDINEKKKYGIRAKEMLEYFKKNFKKEKPILKKKTKNPKKVKNVISYVNQVKINNILEKIEKDNIEYYIDCNKNIIDIENEVYLGYLDGETIHFFN
tara:strand:+ start:515 stop:1048 length:534 start_codon:yes stop_codon:yes gene_type:complete